MYPFFGQNRWQNPCCNMESFNISRGRVCLGHCRIAAHVCWSCHHHDARHLRPKKGSHVPWYIACPCLHHHKWVWLGDWKQNSSNPKENKDYQPVRHERKYCSIAKVSTRLACKLWYPGIAAVRPQPHRQKRMKDCKYKPNDIASLCFKK